MFHHSKKNILSNNANARLLGKNKVVYSRRDEEHDTLVIRDLSDKSNFDHFGVKGVKELERLLFTILGSMSEHRTTLLKRMRFGGDALRQLLDGLSDNDRDMMRSALDACNDGSVQKKRGVKVEMKNSRLVHSLHCSVTMKMDSSNAASISSLKKR